VFVERTPITREVQLLMNVHVLVTEDLRPKVVVQVECEYRSMEYHLHTTPRSATSRDLTRHNLSPECEESLGRGSQFVLLCI
jgi:hypothetical protein